MDKKVVVISGANGGLGRALCKEYAARGYAVVALLRRGEIVESFRHEMLREDCSVTPIKCDVTDEVQCRDALAMVIHHFKRVDVLINNAGRTQISKFSGPEDLLITKQICEVNYFGAVNLTAFSLDMLKLTRGVIINISSVAGFAPLYGRTAYAASKFAMEGFFRTLATENRGHGVHHMVVYPTFIATGIRDQKNQDKTTGEVLSAEYCAQRIAAAMDKRKRKLLLGSTAKKSYFLYKFFPAIYEKVMTKRMESKVDF